MAKRSPNCIKIEIPKSFADIINTEIVGRLGYEDCSEFVTEVLREVLSDYWTTNQESKHRGNHDIRNW